MNVAWAWTILVVVVGASLVVLVTRREQTYRALKDLDRRWIFLLMLLAVAIPILGELTFPEKPTGLAKAVFDEIEKLEPGDKVLMAWDYDPASEGELGPMATAFTYHCCKKGLKMYYMTIFSPVGPQMIEDAIEHVIKADFPHLEYGVDYVNLGYKSGYEGVIKVIVSNIRELYTTDHYGKSVQDIPMMRDVRNIQQMDLIINVSAGYAGLKEWVLFAATPYPDLTLVAGVTGVMAPQQYPYIPEQLRGLLGAIKGAAEYEKLVLDKYGDEDPDPKYLKGKQRMGPQLIAHMLIIVLIIVANFVYFAGKRRERA
ncbi:MAG: hypothetical protein IH888_04780 [Planctomycetes bacterium]|nr:hypothetical protein [Planctomycetota bacterium]